MLNLERRMQRLVKTDGHWFALLESQYGFSFKHANRRYEVAKHVRHLRMVLFWISLFRVRKYFLLEKGYDPVLWNYDEPPTTRTKQVHRTNLHSPCKGRWCQ